MAELETLFVRIEADLSAFKRGMAEARRETQDFAKEARSAFSGVGAALDLSPFRRELAASEAAAKQSAERMKKAFAEVGKVQLESARQVLKTLAQSIDRQSGQPAAKAGAESGQSPGSNTGGFSDFFDPQDAFVGASIAGLLATILIPLITTATAPISVPMLAAAIALSGAISGLKPTLEKIEQSFSADDSDTTSSLDEQIEKLRNTIEDLKENPPQGPRRPRSATGPERVDALAKAQKELTDALAERNALLDIEKMANTEFLVELQRLFGESTSRTQEFLTAFTELSDCLRQLCARIDELSSAPSGAAGAAGAGGVRPDRTGVEGSRDGGQFTLAAFDPTDSPFGGAGLGGLNRELADAGWQVQDLSAGFVELTQATGGYETRAGALVERLIRSNALFGEQSGLLGQLTAQVPEFGGVFATLLERTGQEAGGLNDAIGVLGQGFVDAFEGAIQRGESLSDVLKGLALDLAEIALKTAGNALLESILGGILGGIGGGFGGGGIGIGGGSLGPGILSTGGDILGTPFAKGAAFAPNSVMARNIKEFARGGIVDTPEAFAFAGGLGIMGEAGPEAILPLARARSGELGVRAMLGRQPAAGGSGPAAAGPTFIINAPGADRDGMREVMDFIRFVHGEVVRLDRSIEPRSLRAWANHRRRGGFR